MIRKLLKFIRRKQGKVQKRLDETLIIKLMELHRENVNLQSTICELKETHIAEKISWCIDKEITRECGEKIVHLLETIETLTRKLAQIKKYITPNDDIDCRAFCQCGFCDYKKHLLSKFFEEG